MNFETVLLEINDLGIATLTLNRPARHNAFNEKVIAELHEAVKFLDRHESVRAVVLKGNGKSFSAGADLDWMRRAAKFSKAENEADALALSNMYQALNTLSKPVIALAHGAIMGGGTGLVACADIVLSNPDAVFAFSEVRLGLIPATISPFVIAAIGARQARRYMLSGEKFDGRVAESLGLVHQLVPFADDMAGAAQIFIEKNILGNGPAAVAATKVLIREVSGKPIDDALRKMTANKIAKIRTSDEAKEGLAAFFEKRKPDWQ